MNGEGVYFAVGLDENGEGFAERLESWQASNIGYEFNAAGAAQMLAALIGHFMTSSIDPLAFQSAVMGILATASTDTEAPTDVQ